MSQAPPPPGTPQPEAPMDPQQLNQYALQKVKGPAIALMITGILGVVLGGLNAIYNILMIMGMVGVAANDPNLSAEQANLMQSISPFSGGAGVIFSLIGIVISSLLILATVKMQRLQSFGFAMTMSILAMIPCISPCCILGLPFGIWSLVVLNDAGVKAAFQQNAS